MNSEYQEVYEDGVLVRKFIEASDFIHQIQINGPQIIDEYFSKTFYRKDVFDNHLIQTSILIDGYNGEKCIYFYVDEELTQKNIYYFKLVESQLQLSEDRNYIIGYHL